ncbi:MAG: hypothetical protein AAF570_27260, partial [Bacteroidota bacterium]
HDLEFEPAFSLMGDATTGFRQQKTQGTVRVEFPGFAWPRFDELYYLDALIEEQCQAEKGNECIEGKVLMRVKVDPEGQPVDHEILKTENGYLATVVAKQIYKTGFKFGYGNKGIPGKDMWTEVTVEFARKVCR